MLEISIEKGALTILARINLQIDDLFICMNTGLLFQLIFINNI